MSKLPNGLFSARCTITQSWHLLYGAISYPIELLLFMDQGGVKTQYFDISNGDDLIMTFDNLQAGDWQFELRFNGLVCLHRSQIITIDGYDLNQKVVSKYHAKYNTNNKKYQVWFRNNQPMELLHPRFIKQKHSYIHQNLVVVGIFVEEEYYQFSSAATYMVSTPTSPCL